MKKLFFRSKMEGFDFQKFRSTLRILLERIKRADSEVDAIALAEGHPTFFNQVAPLLLLKELQALDPELVQSLTVEDGTTCTELLSEVASIMFTGFQDEDEEEEDEEEEEEQEEDEDYVESMEEEDDEEYVESMEEDEGQGPIPLEICEDILKLVDYASPSRQQLPYLMALADLANNEDATLNQVIALVDLLLPLCEQWPYSLQRVLMSIQWHFIQ